MYTSTPPLLVLPFLLFVNKMVTPHALFHWIRRAAAPIVRQHPLQSSRLENPADRGSWGATVGGVSESDTTERLSTHTPQYIIAFQHHVEIRCTPGPPFLNVLMMDISVLYRFCSRCFFSEFSRADVFGGCACVSVRRAPRTDTPGQRVLVGTSQMPSCDVPFH